MDQAPAKTTVPEVAMIQGPADLPALAPPNVGDLIPMSRFNPAERAQIETIAKAIDFTDADSILAQLNAPNQKFADAITKELANVAVYETRSRGRNHPRPLAPDQIGQSRQDAARDQGRGLGRGQFRLAAGRRAACLRDSPFPAQSQEPRRRTHAHPRSRAGGDHAAARRPSPARNAGAGDRNRVARNDGTYRCLPAARRPDARANFEKTARRGARRRPRSLHDSEATRLWPTISS